MSVNKCPYIIFKFFLCLTLQYGKKLTKLTIFKHARNKGKKSRSLTTMHIFFIVFDAY